jgi:endo-1,4-beta-xylanase
MNPYANGLPDSVQQTLTKSYTDLFKLFMKYKKNISRVTFWGVNDGQSWLNGWPFAAEQIILYCLIETSTQTFFL